MEHSVLLHPNVPQASSIATLPESVQRGVDRFLNTVSSVATGTEA